MHGRVKVRTTEEQEEAKRKERAAKVKLYRDLTNKIYKKRESGEYDDEALKLTEKVLTPNPEITTLWSYRREIFIEKVKSLEPENVQAMLDSELRFLENCLRVNPKSYSVWHHRCWVMETSPTPDWLMEKKLCDQFLKYDERNFHCWDYRRYVAAKAKLSADEEFQFTSQKIEDNFSNYSAWHYRSTLLPRIHPGANQEVSEAALAKEYELVQNAFFTDPSDQSSWLYHRWLLGRESCPLMINTIVASRAPPTLVITFNRAVCLSDCAHVSIKVGDSLLADVAWSMSTGETANDKPANMWVCSLGDKFTVDNNVKIELSHDQQCVTLQLESGSKDVFWLSTAAEICRSYNTVATSSILESELKSCEQLLELEPTNKWCILTTLLLKQCVDPVKHHGDIVKLFSSLSEVDPYRHGYYADLLSRQMVECALRELYTGQTRKLNLCNKSLTKVYHAELMCHLTVLDVSGNQLAMVHGVHHLKCLVELVLDNNVISKFQIEVTKLPKLRLLSAKNNRISDLSTLKGAAIQELNVAGNPIAQLDGFKDHVIQHLPQLKHLDGTNV